MKTTKTILSIALLALTSSLFARIAEPEAYCNCCPNEVELIMELDLNTEGWMSEPFAGSALEPEITLENWMVAPFEASLEADLALENWMVAPFESDTDEELTLENWMIVPFKSSIENDQLEFESWMADSWI
ncbi:MAG: hypothetical protein ABFS28_11195 [Bacteroidota bacterium]